nr:hypothetical protein [Tanacetum cinerariifolium]
MEYWITNNDLNIWKVIQNGNSLKRTRRDRDGRVIILPPMTADEHIAVQRESKARTTLLQSIPDDHVADFHYMDDTRDIWNAVKARFGRNVESKKIRKSMLKQEFLEFRIGEADGLHKGYNMMHKILTLTLKNKGGLELLSFDDLYYKLKTLEVDVRGYTTFSLRQSAGLSHSAFVSTTSASKKMSYGDSPSYSSTTTYNAPLNSKTGSHRFDRKIRSRGDDLKWQMAMLSVRVHKFKQKARRKIDFDKKESARFNKKKVRCYKCQQRSNFAKECRAKGGNDKQRYSSFKIKEIGKKEEDSKALITVDMLVDWTDHDGESDGVIASKEFGMIAGYDTENAIEEGAAKIYSLITGAGTEEASTACDAGEFVLMGVTSEFDGKADEGHIVGYTASNKAYRVYNVPNKRVEETMNLRYLEEKPNVQGLGHEWYFNLDYLTDTLGYKHDKVNQSAGTHEATTNPAATSEDKRLGLGFTNDAEELQKRASAKIVPPGSIPVPTSSIPVPSSDIMVSTDDVPVHTISPTDSFFDDEPTPRFLSPSDLGNHDPSPGIFSSSSYDDEFCAALNNVASIVEVSPVATKRINTVHPQSLIIGDHTSAVQTRSKVKQTTTGRNAIVQVSKCMVLVDFLEVARIEAIRLFLAFASYMGFMVYQMDVKNVFLYERIDKEVYVTQPKGFVDPQHPKKVYKVVNALYGFIMHQELVYVDDIIFGSTKKAWCDEFEALMKGKFQMSAMGELTFFLGLQVQQRPDGIFINQDKYVQEILNKFDLGSIRTATTPYEAPKPKSKNESDSLVNGQTRIGNPQLVDVSFWVLWIQN